MQVIVAILATVNVYAGTYSVPLNHEYLKYDGLFYPVISSAKVEFNRHRPEVYNNQESGIYGTWIRQWVITQSGVRVRFKTSSPVIKMTFEKREGGGTIGTSPANGFTVFADSIQIASFSSLSFEINNPKSSATLFEVVLPNLWAVNLIGFELEEGKVLEDPAVHIKPVYVSIGNSITHGTGQYVASSKTYPFLLSKRMNWELYNIAVAGATLGWAMALNVKGKKVDVITVKLGFNDWKYLSTPLNQQRVQYERLIDSLRKFQPDAKIYCVTPLYTSDQSGAAPYTLDQFRTMVEEVVTQRMFTDKKLFLFKGPEMSDASMLASGDPVHLSESGAAKLANRLAEAIEHTITSYKPNPVNEARVNIISFNDSILNLDIKKAGNFSIGIFSRNGVQMYWKERLFLQEGIMQINCNCRSSEGDALIIKINSDGYEKSEMKISE